MVDHNDDSYYEWTYGDVTKHYFLYTDHANQPFEDCEGMGLKLYHELKSTGVYTDDIITIEDKGHNKMIFTGTGYYAARLTSIVDGKEVKRYKNIEIPDEVKHLPFIDFRFDVPQNGAITFKIMFEAGVLPAIWPESRQRKQRNSKPAIPVISPAPEALDIDSDVIIVPRQLCPSQIAYNITGDRRKALVAEIANYTGEKAIYQNAPTFAYHIGPFKVDKVGTLSGPIDQNLINCLTGEGFIAE